ncbi:MAG: hypothetical protein FJX76_06550 [Armatimonadetes bacterium]|nr:hypothetical protein [Armatimonadota bacterium]
MQAFHRIYQEPSATSNAFRAEWPWLKSRLQERLVAVGGPSTSADRAPVDWEPRKDRKHEEWRALFEPYDTHFRGDLMLDSEVRVLLVSLLSLTPQDVREMGPERVARVRERCMRIIDASSTLRGRWQLIEMLVVQASNAPHSANGGADVDFVELSLAFQQIERRMRAQQQGSLEY